LSAREKRESERGKSEREREETWQTIHDSTSIFERQRQGDRQTERDRETDRETDREGDNGHGRRYTPKSQHLKQHHRGGERETNEMREG
jgi:hypothetical protein